MGDLGVFEAMANAGKLSAEAAANQGFELEKSIDRAIFRAKEKFGAYLGNSQSKSDWDERWSEVSNQVIRVIAEVVTPTPKIIRRVGAALRPPVQAQAPAKQVRPSSAKTAAVVEEAPTEAPLAVTASVEKTAWAYDQGTKLYTSNDPMVKFACPSCGHEQDHLGFTKCACGRQWNSWPVRQAGSAKTGASTYLLMAREIKMRGDQFKMAAAGNVKVADMGGPQEPPPGMSQPSFGTMPGDNSAAMGAPMPPEQPPTPGGDPDGDGDIAGGVTEGSPIDQIQDALQDAVMALKDVQMLSVNPQLSAMGGLKLSVMAAERAKVQKVAALRSTMDRFWGLHKQWNYVAGMLAKEANEALRATDPRITNEADFIRGYEAAAKNEALPPVEKTGRAYLEGYVAFHKQGQSTPVDGDYDAARGVDQSNLTEPVDQDQSNGARNSGSFLGDVGLDDAANNQSDAGPFDTSQPAQREFASQMDSDNAAGKSRGDQGESSSIQPTSARRTAPKGRK